MTIAGLRKAVFASLAAAALLAACATDGALTQSHQLLEQGRGEEALAVLDRAARAHPDDHSYREAYFSTRDRLATQWFSEAETLREANRFDPAQTLYRRILAVDPGNPRAKAGLARLERDRRSRTAIDKAEQLVEAHRYDEAKEALAPVLKEDPKQRDARRLQRLIDDATMKPENLTPRLNASISQPISLQLPNVSLRTAFDVLSRATKLNFLFDRDVNTDQTTSVVVRNEKVEDVIRQILIANQLKDKVLNGSTALIYPNTPQKLSEYQDLVVKSFYVSNADVRQTANMLRAILKTRDIFVDEKKNLLVMKDTPKEVERAGRLIAAQNLAEPEAVLEVEVLEVSFDRLRALGMQYPSTLAWSLQGGNSSSGPTPGVVTLPQWLARDSGLVQLRFSDPLFLLSLSQTDSSTNLLANPRIRVKNREKATIHIGERVPVITTTAAATGGFLSQSVSYLDVGLKLEVEPEIYLDDDVGIKVGLEVSNITNTIQSPSGDTVTYQIGTRTANTTLRLHDGETEVLAGLIDDEDRRNANRVPGLGDLPILGHLFSSTSNSKSKSEIVLLITPHIVRNQLRPDARDLEFSAGTEGAAGPSFGAMISPPPRPAIAAPAPAPKAEQPAGNSMSPFGGMQAPRQP